MPCRSPNCTQGQRVVILVTTDVHSYKGLCGYVWLTIHYNYPSGPSKIQVLSNGPDFKKIINCENLDIKGFAFRVHFVTGGSYHNPETESCLNNWWQTGQNDGRNTIWDYMV